MKKILIIIAMVSLTACAAKNEESKKPTIGIANPASVYCGKIGGKLDIVKGPTGEVGYCTLPGGERIEEWLLFRRDHKAD